MREPTFQAMREALSANACAETTDWKDGVSVEAATFSVYPRHVHVERESVTRIPSCLFFVFS